MEEKKYAQGLFVKRNEKAPDFVVCSLSIKAEEFNQFIEENVNEKGYVNLQILKRKEKGTLYAVLDTFEPKASTASTATKKAVKTQNSDPFQNGNSGGLPF